MLGVLDWMKSLRCLLHCSNHGKFFWRPIFGVTTTKFRAAHRLAAYIQCACLGPSASIFIMSNIQSHASRQTPNMHVDIERAHTHAHTHPHKICSELVCMCAISCQDIKIPRMYCILLYVALSWFIDLYIYMFFVSFHPRLHTVNSFTVVASFLQSNEYVNKYRKLCKKCCVYLKCRWMQNNAVEISQFEQPVLRWSDYQMRFSIVAMYT